MAGTGSTVTITVAIPLDENEPLGVRPNDGLVITDVQEGTPAAGHLKIGDTIQTVNGRAIPNLRAFYQYIRIAHPVATIGIKRPRSKEEIPPEVRTDPDDNLPPEIRQVISRRPGYHYQQVRIERARGLRFGLAIKTRENRVLVTQVQPNTMCSSHFAYADHIIYVDGVRVTQAEVAQTLLTKALKTNGQVDCVIGRPASPEAVEAAKQTLNAEDKHEPPSVRLSIDVVAIMKQQMLNMAANNGRQLQPILAHGPAAPPAPDSRVKFSEQHFIYQIPSDHVGRPLRPVTIGIPINSPVRQQQPQP